MKLLLSAAGLSLALAATAHAQTPQTQSTQTEAPAVDPSANPPGAVNPPNPAAPPATSATAPSTSVDTSATTSPYKTGMVIKDAQGGVVGAIARVIRTPDGATTISASIDGRNVNLPASALTLGADGGAVSSMTKAQITASTAPPI